MRTRFANGSLLSWSASGLGLALLAGLLGWSISWAWQAPSAGEREQGAASRRAPVAPAPAPPADPRPLKAKGPAHPRPSRLLKVAVARLHNEALSRFVADPRNGVRRMSATYRLVAVKVGRPWPAPAWSPGELDGQASVAFEKDLPSIHGDTVADFRTAPERLEVPYSPGDVFPYGTQSVQGMPLSSAALRAARQRREGPWEVKSIDLVGLLLRTEPVVYVSETVPEMKRLGRASTRPPDVFELAGLEALRGGDDLFVRRREGVVRALGAVRGGPSCLRCHAGHKEGDLLGAFSYTLRRGEYRMGLRRGAHP